MARHDEIRARCEAGRPLRRIDMIYLLGEVDRLTAEAACLKSDVARYKGEAEGAVEGAKLVIDGQQKTIDALTSENSRLGAEVERLAARSAAAERDLTMAIGGMRCDVCANDQCQYADDEEIVACSASMFGWRGPQTTDAAKGGPIDEQE